MSEDAQATAAPPDSGVSGPEAGAPAGAAQAPLCFIVDEESSIRHFVSLILHGIGVDTMEFADGAAFRAARSTRPPDIVFLNINLDANDTIHSLEALGRTNYTGAVQLMSQRGAAVLESLKHIGETHRLRMLPVLKKPFETSAIQKIFSELKLGFANPVAARVGLGEALQNNWVEFWYQPKVDMRRKQLAGAEVFARVIHPQHGVLMPGSFMPGADDASLLKLAEMSLTDALKAGAKFAKVGIPLRMATNISIAALQKLPVGEIVRAQYPDANSWPGLIIDLTEEQVVKEISTACELAKQFEPFNVRLAIDDFGRAHSSLTKVRDMSFAEMKLDRSFVTDCGTDKVNAPICKTVIDLAHSFGSLAVGIGIEKASELTALVSMGCDLGQGFLLGQPMPEDRFLALLKQRATVRPANVVKVGPPATAAAAAAS
jgi:EAL domain-containing protein (putative c-di-GMP-specific phosphodiesterase class I)/CheY-like chemotaxis protein